MENQTSPSSSQNDPFYKIIWLVFAFVPVAVTALCIKKEVDERWSLVVLVGLGIVCSAVSAVGLVRGMRNRIAQVIVGLLLILFFLVVNAYIAVFVGCSGIG